jgi:hypothetical protein
MPPGNVLPDEENLSGPFGDADRFGAPTSGARRVPVGVSPFHPPGSRRWRHVDREHP